MQQPALHLALQQLPDRLPITAGRLHPDSGHPKLASHSANSTSPAVVVVTRRVSAWRPPWPPGTRTHAVTERAATSAG
jgi:hypothetical protein